VLSETDALLRILIAAGLGAVLGFEREFSDKPAGLRTHMLVTEGAALFMVGSLLIVQEFTPGPSSLSLDPTRVASTIVTGIGFLGGGAILQSRDRVKGITTAAAIWVAAAIGLLVGAGFYLVAAGGVGIAVVTLTLLSFPERWIGGSESSRYHIHGENQDDSPPANE
jgi:putative Mg2+ transporter-C (MgtC) family protein